MSDIEWTDVVWNPVLGCSRVSAGCEHCYAERFAHRGLTPDHQGLTVMGSKGPRWTGLLRFMGDRLEQPLRWRKPRRVFVNSMSDLFHEDVPDEFIDRVFAVMALTPKHTYQVLTKRPKRMREYFADIVGRVSDIEQTDEVDAAQRDVDGFDDAKSDAECAQTLQREIGLDNLCRLARGVGLPNVWLGVSVEDQATADERIPLLLECPAAVRWVSYEPALGPVDFRHIFEPNGGGGAFGYDALVGESWAYGDEETAGALVRPPGIHAAPRVFPGHFGDASLDWIVVGGESGPGARPFDLQWARNVVRQCAEAEVPVFVKQLGAWAFMDVDDWCDWPPPRPRFQSRLQPLGAPLRPVHEVSGTEVLRVLLSDRKGGDMDEWPEDLRVRQWPEGHT